MQKHRDVRWKDEFYVRAYKFAREGATDAEIAQSLGFDPSQFRKMIASNGALRGSIDEGRGAGGPKGKSGYETFKDFAYGRLPPEMMELWDGLESIEGGKGRDEMLDIISARPTRTQQHLFLHALLSSNFMTTVACAKLGLSPAVVTYWVRDSPDFAALVKGVHELKRDFFESHFIDLVRRGDSAATIFAVKTMCKERGYGNDKLTIEMKQDVTHTHTVSLDDLPVEAQRAYLAALRKKQQEQLSGPVEDAEIVG